MAEQTTYPNNTVAWIRVRACGEWILAIAKNHTWVFMLATNDQITGSVSPLSAVVDVLVIERPGDDRPPVTAEPARSILQEALGITDDTAEGLPTEAMARDAAEFIARARRDSADEEIPAAPAPEDRDDISGPVPAGLRVTTAPSVEQIAEVLMDWVIDPSTAAEAIHALYGTPGDAGEHGSDVVDRTEHERMRKRAEKAEAELGELRSTLHILAARRDDLEVEVEETNEMRINLANRVAEVENIARAEVERYKAALEAAEALLLAKDDVDEAESEVRRTLKAKDEAIDERDLARAAFLQANDAYDAARAAVEAETSEGGVIEVGGRLTLDDLPMGGCRNAATHEAHLATGVSACENEREGN